MPYDKRNDAMEISKRTIGSFKYFLSSVQELSMLRFNIYIALVCPIQRNYIVLHINEHKKWENRNLLQEYSQDKK